MTFYNESSKFDSKANETWNDKENSLAGMEREGQRDFDMRLGLCSYDKMMREIIAHVEGLAPGKKSSELRGSEKNLTVYGMNDVSESRTELRLDPESVKIYTRANVEVTKNNVEVLAGQEYRILKLKEISPTLECPDGRTNKERMDRGLAPYVDSDGKLVKVELHHHGQNANGPLVEIGSDAHKENDAALHPGSGKGEGRGFDPLWDQKRCEHWQIRAKEI